MVNWLIFQVTLASSHKLGFIRIFGLDEEVERREVQTVTIRSKSELEGSFTLNVTDAQGVSAITGK